MRRTMSRVGALLVVITLMTGCTSTAKDPTGPTPTPTVKSPSPTPTPTDGPADLSDPELGIVFETAPDLHGDAADAYDIIALFEHESWSTMTTHQISSMFSTIASTEVQAQIQTAEDWSAEHGAVYGGVLHVRVDNIVVNGDTASGSVCENYADATFADTTRTYTPEEAGFGQPWLMNMTLTRVSPEGLWRVMTIKENGTC